MTAKDRLLYLASSGLPLGALALYSVVGTSNIAYAATASSCASGECVYASECYSDGARIDDSCSEGKVQVCSSGRWSACE